jgi:diguanylate cyclase (GGDEF)-like protein
LQRLDKQPQELLGQPAASNGLCKLRALSERTDNAATECRLQRGDGDQLWVRARQARELGGDEDQTRHFVLEDISLEKKIQAIAERDVLTGAYNRVKFDHLLEEALAARARYGQIFSVVLCDIDYFKRINDQHGHLAGDEVLKQFSTLLDAKTRATDQLARWGGEEFVLLLPMTKVEHAAAAAETLRKAVVDKTWPAIERLSASFGVAGHRPNETAEALFSRVDAALYRAKEDGRDRVCVAT